MEKKYIQRQSVYTCGMKKKVGLYIRVSEGWMSWLRSEAGGCGEGVSEYVRRAVGMRMGLEEGDGEEVEEEGVVGVAQAPVVVVEAIVKEEAVEEKPAWKVKLEMQMAEREKRGFSVLPGSAAPSAVAAVSAPSGEGRVAPGTRYAPMRGRTEEERAEALARLGGLKLMPQMKKTEFYPDEEPNEENT